MSTCSRTGPETLLVMGQEAFDNLFGEEQLERLAAVARLRDPVHATEFNEPAARARLAEVEVLVTGWGCPELTAEIVTAAPDLRMVVHAAGSVRFLISDACWERGIRVSTAADANGIPVAEYALGAVLFAGKRVPMMGMLARQHRSDWRAYRRKWQSELSNYRRTIGVLGFSRIGKRVIELLAPFDFEVLVADPYADTDAIAACGARHMELDDMLKRCDVLSVHAPLLQTTRGLLDARRLGLLSDGATVVNTARGAIIDHDALATECASGRLSAILDVVYPEPLPDSSPLYDLPNVLITPHIAGAMGTETHRLADSAIAEVERWARGEPPRHEVVKPDLDRIA